MKPVLWVLAGPTASGKTAVACALAKRFLLEAVSCDSMQVYKRMPILSQAPSASEKKTMGAHLVSFLEPTEEYNAAMFRKDATAAIAAILKKKRRPLLVGGTGLYLRALLDGIFENEEDRGRDEAFRQKMLKESQKHGGGHLHEKLKLVDAPSAARIHPNDTRRLIRALEVHHVTGIPMSAQRSNRSGLRETFDCRLVYLDRDRQDLYGRIDTRVDEMMKKGLLKEVRRLRRLKLSQTASMAIGYREICDHLDGSPLQRTIDSIKQHTRNYAKRQLSWFRHEKGMEPVPVEKGESAPRIAERIARMLA